MRFADPAWLWGLLLVPALALAFVLDAARRRHLVQRLGDVDLLRDMVRTASDGRRLLRALFVTCGVGLCVVGLARPQYGGRSKLVKSRGIDVVVALDLSKSMLARDLRPSRLDRAKAELDRLMDGVLVGDRIGMVAFAGTTASYPLTTDTDALELFYRDLSPADMPVGGTAIGRAIHAALDLLRAGAAPGTRTRVVILVTDGEDTMSDPIAAAEEANRLGVRIYTVGIGTRSGEPVPEVDDGGRIVGYMHKPGGEPGYVTATLDEATLRRVAERTGGHYYRIDPQRFGLDALVESLGQLKKQDAESRVLKTYEEAAAWFLFPGFLLLLIEVSLGDRKGRRALRTEQAPRGAPRTPAPRQGIGRHDATPTGGPGSGRSAARERAA